MTTNPDNTRTAGAAKDEAANVKDKAFDAAGQVAGTAKEEAANVKDEAMKQARSLTDSALEEVNTQASTQQKRIAEQSRTITDDLSRLARGERAESDMVNQFISMAADRAQQFTTQLENKEPKELLNDVRRFAARRPGTFLAIAAGIGIVAGRFTRGLSDRDDDTPTTTPSQPKSGISNTGLHPTQTVVPPVEPGLVDPVSGVAPADYPGTAPGAAAGTVPGTVPGTTPGTPGAAGTNPDLPLGGHPDPLAGRPDPLGGGLPDDLTDPNTRGGRL
ncbi:hypothetical protein HMPREF0290_2792 [Corynebacterium efficiens YS-314]|nr:hypothetical protein [Corynebacterium efficiens]EEW48596.1 hypothetical protein HMPREF0290_2792 [Corynebacterium efficiens YS-314]